MFTDGQNRIGQRGGLHERQPDPSPIQIRAMMALIRMGWSDLERRSRWQLSEWRRQARHCPPELRQMLSEST